MGVRESGRRALVVVVPALDEAARIGACLDSLAAQDAPLQIFVSDNDSSDDTASIARSYAHRLPVTVRSVARLPASPHFVSAARWALGATDAPVYALLAGDDTWEPGFAREALALLERRPEVDVVYPTFRWEAGEVERVLPPVDFVHRAPLARQARALVMADRRELANLVYGVYRREAFAALVDEWERGGDAFGSDFAAAWSVLGRHRAAACPGAVGRRHERRGADLLQRVGISREAARGPLGLVRAYLVLNVRVNAALARALRCVTAAGWSPPPWQVHLLRAPQWVWGAWRQVATARRPRGQASRSRGAAEHAVAELGHQRPP